MGDMSDYHLEQIEYEEFLKSQYRIGKLSPLDAYESGIIDEIGYDITPYQNKTCKCCNKSNLHWKTIDGKWRLFENKTNKLHNCKVNPLT